jgi:hypothetical protein
MYRTEENVMTVIFRKLRKFILNKISTEQIKICNINTKQILSYAELESRVKLTLDTPTKIDD